MVRRRIWPQRAERLAGWLGAALGRRSVVALSLAAAVVVGLFAAATGRQQPRDFYDSSAFFEAARKPWSFDQLLYPKPMLTSLVYRALGGDRVSIAYFQAGLALLSWLCLAVALAAFFRRTSARVAALVVAALFVLHPIRIGYADALLSESLNDSLMALWLAAALGLLAVRARAVREPVRARATLALSLALVALLAAWMLTRDTNAIVMLVAIGLAAGLWGRPLWRSRWGVVGLVALAAAAGFVLWSTTAIPAQTEFSVQREVPRDFTGRASYAKMNVVVDRILPDPEARAYFAARGLQLTDELARLENRADIIYLPRFEQPRRWIASESRGAYLRWLLAHPRERLTDQVEYAWTFLGIVEQHAYMPDGWIGRTKAVRWVLGVATSHPVLLALLALCPLALWRSRRHAGSRVALCLIVSGWIGSVAAFYADSAEPGRHCYGSGQQIVFGLFLASLTWLEHGVRRRTRDTAGASAIRVRARE